MKPYRVQPDKCVISSAIMMRETRATTRVRKQPRIGTTRSMIVSTLNHSMWPLQGHYANDPNAQAAHQPADITVAQIGDLLYYHSSALVEAGRLSATNKARAPK